ncbi:MAG: Ig-like domain-containing protein [Flavobacteriaceae bacterium]|nr:Ig-like domain-containing protein [Flavobacteriaceae bacterium]
MKKTVQLMSFLALIAFMIFTSCEKDEPEIMVESISVTPNTLEKTEGDAPLKITATVLPKNATNKKVEWTSSNEKVATVVDGMITFKSVGKATITVSAVDKSGKMAICNVTVKAKAISVTGIALDKTELTKEEGETEQLTATITPANATDKTLTWASSDDKIAIVDANGKIATIKEGKTTITVTTKDGSKTAKCELTVKAKTIFVAGVTIDKTEVTKEVGETEQLTAIITPANATDKALTWESSDEEIATVDTNGKVTALKEGKTTIIVITKDGNKIAKSKVIVTNKTPDITIGTQKVNSLEVGKTATLLTITAGSGDYTVTSSDTNKATVTEKNGVITVTPLGEGDVTISIKDNKTGQTKTVKVAVTTKTPDLAINKKDVSLEVGQTTTVNITAGSGDYMVTSSDKEVAIAENEKGLITIAIVKEGNVTVTIKDNKTKQTKTIKITATAKTTDLEISREDISLEIGKTTTVNITAGSGDYTVTSSNKEVAVAENENGAITIAVIKKGNATITIKDNKTGQTKTIEVISKTPDLVVSHSNVVLPVEGPVGRVNITSGSGDYTVTSSNTAVVEVSEKDGIISIYNVSTGKVTITVKDNKTRQTKQIKVTVTGKDLVVTKWVDEDGNDLRAPEESKNAKEAVALEGYVLVKTENDGFGNVTHIYKKSQDQPYIEISSDTVNTEIGLAIYADEKDQANVWIDLNNNGVKDDGENVKRFHVDIYGDSPYNITSKTIRIYGKVKRLGVRGKTFTNIDISNNINLEALLSPVQSPKLTRLDLSQNPNLKEFRSDYNKNITCIKVSQAQLNNIPSDWQKADTATYDTDCANEGGTIANNQPYIEITTTKAVGETIKLALSAEDKESVWIDLNNNGVKDTNEGDIQFYSDINNLKKEDYKDYTLGSQTIRIYGKVKVFITYYDWNREQKKYIGHHITKLDISNNLELDAFSVSYNELSNLDVSQNTTLKWFRSDFNSLTSLDISKNTQLEKMSCRGNQLSSLDISKNRALKGLDCSENKLTNIDISQNTLLNWLNCRKNQLSNVDISQNMALTWLNCGGNQISNLEVSQNTNLEYLYCSSNQLSNINVSQNTALKELNCDFNQLTNLDVSQNTKLKSLFCRKNQLSSLVLDNPDLIKIECEENQLSSIDVSKDIALVTLGCNNNQLTSLDVSKNPKLMWFWCFKNPNLTCIKVSQEQLDSDYVTTKNYNWQKDKTATYNTNCTNGGGTTPSNQSYIEFTTTKAVGETIEIVVNANPEDQADVWIDLNNNGTRESGEEITKFVAFDQWKTVKKGYNDITSYTIGSQTMRVYGEVTAFSPYGYFDYDEQKPFGQELTKLDVTHNTKLEHLYFIGNKELEEIDLSVNSRLRELICLHNSLKELNISNNTELEILICWHNKLTQLETYNNIQLRDIDCRGNQISQLDVSNNRELYHLNCGPANLTSIDISQNLKLNSLDVSYNPIRTIDVSQNKDLRYLRCESNDLENIDVSKNCNLEFLRCSFNPLGNLDVSNNTNLISFECKRTQITHLDVSMCSKLAPNKEPEWIKFDCTKNDNLTCVKVSQEQLDNTEKNWKKDDHTQYSTNCNGYSGRGSEVSRRSAKSTYHKPTKFYYKRENGRVIAVPVR